MIVEKKYRNSRLEFERHINLLIESILNKKMIPKDYLKSDDGIHKMRHSPNNRINLNTIDESTRVMAMRSVMDKYIEYEKSLVNNKESLLNFE